MNEITSQLEKAYNINIEDLKERSKIDILVKQRGVLLKKS